MAAGIGVTVFEAGYGGERCATPIFYNWPWAWRRHGSRQKPISTPMRGRSIFILTLRPAGASLACGTVNCLIHDSSPKTWRCLNWVSTSAQPGNDGLPDRRQTRLQPACLRLLPSTRNKESQSYLSYQTCKARRLPTDAASLQRPLFDEAFARR